MEEVSSRLPRIILLCFWVAFMPMFPSSLKRPLPLGGLPRHRNILTRYSVHTARVTWTLFGSSPSTGDQPAYVSPTPVVLLAYTPATHLFVYLHRKPGHSPYPVLRIARMGCPSLLFKESTPVRDLALRNRHYLRILDCSLEQLVVCLPRSSPPYLGNLTLPTW